MTTTHPDPHTCAHGVELRTAEEIEAERQHYRMRCEALWPGWKLVPVEPTFEMLMAMDTEFEHGMSQRELKLWKAGVAAAIQRTVAAPASPA